MRDNIVQFSEESQESGLDRVRKKSRRMRIGRVYRILLIILLFAGILLAYFIYEKTKVYSSYTVRSSVQRTSIDGASLAEFDGSILTYSKDGAGAIDASGKLLWNQTFDMQNPMMSMCGDTVAFADYGGSNIFIQKSNGETGKVSTNKPIKKIATSSNGYVVAVLDDSDVTWICMYDLNGKEISKFRTTMEKSGYPLDVDVSPSGELVVVSYYYIDCNDVKSSVAFFNFGEVGQNQIDNCVSGYNYSDTMIPFVKFLDDKTAIAVSPKRFCVYGGAHIPVSQMESFILDDILSVYYSNDAVAIIYKSALADSKYRLELYDTLGQTLLTKEFSFDYSNVVLDNSRLVLYGDENIYISTYSGEEKYEGTYSEPIRLVVPTLSQSEYVIVTEKSVDTVRFE